MTPFSWRSFSYNGRFCVTRPRIYEQLPSKIVKTRSPARTVLRRSRPTTSSCIPSGIIDIRDTTDIIDTRGTIGAFWATFRRVPLLAAAPAPRPMSPITPTPPSLFLQHHEPQHYSAPQFRRAPRTSVHCAFLPWQFYYNPPLPSPASALPPPAPPLSAHPAPFTLPQNMC